MVEHAIFGIDEIMSDELQNARLWKTLDTISSRLGNIEIKLSDIARIDERVKSQEKTLESHSAKLDSHDSRVRHVELTQAHAGDSVNTIASIKKELDSIKEKIEKIESISDIASGQKDVSASVIKWIAGIAAALIIYGSTKGF